MSWQDELLRIITRAKEENIALVVDTSTNDYPIDTIRNIISLFNEVKKSTPLLFVDYKIRDITDTEKAKEFELMNHGKASYTDALDWASENNIDKLFYITDVTGYFWEEQKVDYEIFWLIPDSFTPKVPFGKSLNLV